MPELNSALVKKQEKLFFNLLAQRTLEVPSNYLGFYRVIDGGGCSLGSGYSFVHQWGGGRFNLMTEAGSVQGVEAPQGLT